MGQLLFLCNQLYLTIREEEDDDDFTLIGAGEIVGPTKPKIQSFSFHLITCKL